MATPAGSLSIGQPNRPTADLPAPRGRDVSRRNSMTHGLSGSGKVIPEADRAEVDRKAAAFIRDLHVQTETGRDLARQMAVMSVRMDRCANHETVAIAHSRRHAVDRHDDGRQEEAVRLFAALGESPYLNLFRLKRMPEGIRLLVDAWRSLRVELTRTPRPRWTTWHRERAEHLTGNRLEDNPYTEIGDLSEAIIGPTDPDGRSKAEALATMIERIDAEVADLEAHETTLDHAILDLDRIEAPDRALFDDSKGANLARRYEAEASRRFFKLKKQLDEIEAEAAERPPSPATFAPPIGSVSASSFAAADPAPAISFRAPAPTPPDSVREAATPDAREPFTLFGGMELKEYISQLERLGDSGHYDDPDAEPLMSMLRSR
jgi:hypothetical protein